MDLVRVRRASAEAHSLVHDNGDGIVKQALSKDDAIEFWVDLVLGEYGENSDRIGGAQCRAKDEAVQYRQVESFETEE